MARNGRGAQLVRGVTGRKFKPIMTGPSGRYPIRITNSGGPAISTHIPSTEQRLFAEDAPKEHNRQVAMFQLAERHGSDICDCFPWCTEFNSMHSIGTKLTEIH
jgi:hypothetical protein